MFILDSLLVSGIQWALKTTLAAAEAEMNDDTVLREQLLEAEMRREAGEISDEAFAEIEADLLARIRAIRERTEGSGQPAPGGGQLMETSSGTRFQVEADVAGDFHAGADRSSDTAGPGRAARPRRAGRSGRARGPARATKP